LNKKKIIIKYFTCHRQVSGPHHYGPLSFLFGYES
jgi:hypothetical protein